MPRKKKQFIDKKKSVRFAVVHRDQRDPLAFKDESSAYVLQPVRSKAKMKTQAKILTELPQDCLQFEGLEGDDETGEFFDAREAEEEELSKKEANAARMPWGYDYSQHMKEIGKGTFVASKAFFDATTVDMRSRPAVAPESKDLGPKVSVGGVALPASVFASETEAHVGAMAHAEVDMSEFGAVRPEQAGRDFVECLEGDFEEGKYEEILDDFFATANAEVEDEKTGSGMGMPNGILRNGGGDEGGEEDFFGEELSDEEELSEERKMTLLDEHFERLMEAEYDEDEYGSGVEVDGEVNSEDEGLVHETTLDLDTGRGAEIMDDFEIKKRAMRMKPNDLSGCDKDAAKAQIARGVQRQAEEAEGKDDDEEIRTMFKKKIRDKWDCESILSTYSNLENHPNLIKAPKRKPHRQIKLNRHGLPEDTVNQLLKERRDAFRSGAAEGDRPGLEDLSEGSEYEEEEPPEPVNLGAKRPKKESAAVRKARKAAVKEQRRLNRMRKKSLKRGFKEAEATKNKTDFSNRKNNVPGIKM